MTNICRKKKKICGKFFSDLWQKIDKYLAQKWFFLYIIENFCECRAIPKCSKSNNFDSTPAIKLSKLARHLWSKKMHFNRSSSNFTNWFSTYLIRIFSKIEWIPSFPFDFIRGQSLTSHDDYTRRLWAVATVLEVLLVYILKHKLTIPSIL